MRANPLLAVLFLSLTSPVLATPPLPAGLQQEQEEPALPQGLGTSPAPQTPPLPAGLGLPSTDSKKKPAASESWQDRLGILFTGFIEARAGARLQADPYEKGASIAETRMQLSGIREGDIATATLTADMLYDPVLDDFGISLETGRGWLDIREANLLFRPTSFSDLKVGRQVLTWGTGDLLFINDLFPKDWNSFFIGRDEEYLKAPSDAVKLSLFADFANLDIVYTPRFDGDRFIDGERISYFNPMLGRRAGRDAIANPEPRNDWFGDDELSLRLYRSFGAMETALYFYDGYWKSPTGFNPASGRATYPRLRVFGASARKPMFGGLVNAEVGFYDSRDDSAGTDPFVNNDEFRALIGYEKELGTELTGAFQYYVERLMDYDAYRSTLPLGMAARDKLRHMVTARLTKMLMNQNLILSFFAFYSPSDQDAYIRPKVTYKLNDAWRVEAGGNIFLGKNDYSFFGQFEKNTNAFVAVRRSF